jgi:large subunit ribosomal protein L15
MFQDGDVVNLIALRDKGFLKGTTYGLKVLGHGEITKKVTIEAHALSASAKEKMDRAGVSYSIV